MRAFRSLAILPVIAFPAADVRAKGPWEEPVTLDRGAVSSPSVAVGEGGRVAAAWMRSGAVRAIAEPASGVVTVQAAGQVRAPEAATYSRGAVLAYVRRGRVESRRVSGRSGAVSLPSRLSPAGATAFDPTFVGGTGPTVLAWLVGRDDPQLQIGVPRSTGTFVGSLRYALDGLLDIDFVTTRSGGLLAAYTRRTASREVELMVAEQQPGSARLVEIARMAATGTPSDVSVTVTRGGRSVIGWTDTGGVKVVERPRGGAFGQPVTLSAQPGAGLALLPKADGPVLASWLTRAGTLRVADSRGGAVRSLATRTGDYTATVDGRGAAHFAWISGGTVYSRLVDDRERIAARRTLSEPGERARAVALSAGSRAAAAVYTTANAVRMTRR